MVSLFSELYEYIKRRWIVFYNSVKASRLEVEYNEYILKLGKKSQELDLDKNLASDVIQQINELNKQMKSVDQNIEDLYLELDKEHKIYEEIRNQNNIEAKNIINKITEIKNSSQPYQEEINKLNNEINTIQKDIKKKNQEITKIDKELSKLSGSDVEGDISESASALDASKQNFILEIEKLNEILITRKEEIQKVHQELKPFSDDLQKVQSELSLLKIDWKKKEEQHEAITKGLNKDIERQLKRKQDLDNKLILPYRELGTQILKDPIQHAELDTIYQEIGKLKNDLTSVQQIIFENQMILKSPLGKRSRNYFILFTSLILVIFILFLVVIYK